MFRRIAVIQEPNPLELAQVIRRALKRHLETPCEKTDAHVHIWNFVLVSHDLNIDYLHKKTRRGFVSKQKKSLKRINGVPRPMAGGGLSLHEAVASPHGFPA
jgi:hypothetical protein